MKTPTRDLLEPQVLAVELALDAAIRRSFDEDSCLELTLGLDNLFSSILEDGETIPIGIEDSNALTSKALVMVDIAYACWVSDEPAISLPQDVLLNHIARMKLNAEHCKLTLELARLHLKKYGKLLSVAEWSLRV